MLNKCIHVTDRHKTEKLGARYLESFLSRDMHSVSENRTPYSITPLF